MARSTHRRVRRGRSDDGGRIRPAAVCRAPDSTDPARPCLMDRAAGLPRSVQREHAVGFRQLRGVDRPCARRLCILDTVLALVAPLVHLPPFRRFPGVQPRAGVPALRLSDPALGDRVLRRRPTGIARMLSSPAHNERRGCHAFRSGRPRNGYARRAGTHTCRGGRLLAPAEDRRAVGRRQLLRSLAGEARHPLVDMRVLARAETRHPGNRTTDEVGMRRSARADPRHADKRIRHLGAAFPVSCRSHHPGCGQCQGEAWRRPDSEAGRCRGGEPAGCRRIHQRRAAYGADRRVRRLLSESAHRASRRRARTACPPRADRPAPDPSRSRHGRHREFGLRAEPVHQHLAGQRPPADARAPYAAGMAVAGGRARRRRGTGASAVPQRLLVSLLSLRLAAVLGLCPLLPRRAAPVARPALPLPGSRVGTRDPVPDLRQRMPCRPLPRPSDRRPCAG